MKVSVIVPSRLRVNPASRDGRLLLDRSLMAAKRQTAEVEMEIFVGIDPGTMAAVPQRFLEVCPDAPVTFVEAATAGQAAAVNAAASRATGDVVALLEDDDIWDPTKLAVQLPLLDRYDLVTCNQREVDEDGNYLRVNDFATPSGWVMARTTWRAVGGFDESFRFHVDNEWLGRANALGLKRAHVVHASADQAGDWLTNVRRHSDVLVKDDLYDPLVTRVVMECSGMRQIATDPEAKAQSVREHEVLIQKFGTVPW